MTNDGIDKRGHHRTGNKIGTKLKPFCHRTRDNGRRRSTEHGLEQQERLRGQSPGILVPNGQILVQRIDKSIDSDQSVPVLPIHEAKADKIVGKRAAEKIT